MPRKRFTPYNKPLAPVKPRECISRSEPVFSISMELYSSLTLTAEIREALIRADSIYIADVDLGYDDTIDSIQLSFRSSIDYPNPNYEQQLEIYLEEYSAYREKLAWWRAAERRQLERLQKKYGTKPNVGDEVKIQILDLQGNVVSVTEIDALSVQITEAFNGVDFCTEDGNHLAVLMRDDGYEVHYYGKDFDAGWTEFKSGRLPKTQDTDNAGDLLQTAWGVIANVSRGDWSTQSDEWRHAALRFRDRYHLWLDEEVAPENEVVPNNTEEPLDDSATLRSYIFQAIGEASACWENLSGTGVYDVEHATKIANELCKNLGIEPLEQ